MASEELGELLRNIRADLDLFDQRLSRLEESPVTVLRMEQAITHRRALVRRMREIGMSIDRISISANIPRSTVVRDLRACGIPPGETVLGLDGKVWHRPSATDR